MTVFEKEIAKSNMKSYNNNEAIYHKNNNNNETWLYCMMPWILGKQKRTYEKEKSEQKSEKKWLKTLETGSQCLNWI